jgi:lipopolysaccharide transport system ATP-binding protein
MSDLVLEIDHVSKKFRKGEIYDSLRDWIPALVRRLARKPGSDKLSVREFWALKDVSVAVKHGEVLGIIGHNGAGKSTMLKLLSGIMQPTKGAIRVNGTLSALIEVGAGFHQDLTGRQNIYLNGAILGMSRAQIAKKFDQIVAFSGLEEFLDTPVKRYSSGMYARLGFSVAAHIDPDVLIVDEVLSVGDYLFQNKCMERMREVVRSGAAVIFVSHNLQAVANLCTRGILLEHGNIVQDGGIQDVIRTYLSKSADRPNNIEHKEVYISDFVLRDHVGPRVRFETGEDAWLDIHLTANQPCERLSLAVKVEDQNSYRVFDTSTERLGYPSISLAAGETVKTTIRLKLNLARGVFRVGVHVNRYDIEKMYDDRMPLATIFVTSARDVRGLANLEPEVEHFAVPTLVTSELAVVGSCSS